MLRFGQPILRSLLTPAFLVCVAIVSAAAMGLKPGMRSLARRYAKEPILLRRPLSAFDVSTLKSFRRALHPRPAIFSTRDMGTDQMVCMDLDEKHPGSKIENAWLFVTYYSNPRDKVPHTPEVCYRQSGTIVENIRTMTLDVPELAPDRSPIKVRVLELYQRGARAVAIYVFCANGEFCYGRNQVRWIIGRPGDRYVYFSKIEVVVSYERGVSVSDVVEVCKQLLREALPTLVAEHFPDREALKSP